MMRRVWVLAVGLGVLPGCLHRGPESVPPGVLAGLVARVPEAEPEQLKPTSPYDARALAPMKEEPQTAEVPPEQKPDPPRPHAIADTVPPPPPAPSALPELPETKQVSLAVLTPEKPEDSLGAAFRCFREDRRAEALEKLKAFEPAQGELLGLLLPLAGKLADLKSKDFAALAVQFEDTVQALRARSALSLEKVCFCRTIERFGVYDPLPAGHVFAAGGEGRPGEIVRLYVEVGNFASRRTEGAYETALACTMVLTDHVRNRIVWRQDRSVEVERSRSPRRDCYLPCYFYVPPKLPVGDYTLTIQVTDLTGRNGEEAPPHRSAKRSLEFHVGSKAQDR